MKKSIAVDIDNILTNTTECVLQYINERIPSLNLKIEDIKEYWMENQIPQEYRWIVEMAFEDKKMWKNVRMIEGAVEALKKLYEDGYEIYFATATTAENFRKKVGFLTRNLPFLPEGYVKQHAISIKHKQLLNVDFMIDDYLENLIAPRPYISICMEYPWNDIGIWNRYTKDETMGIYYAKDWAGIYNIIKDFEVFIGGENK